MEKFTENIWELISKDMLKEAILEMRKLTAKSPKLDELILHSARHNDLTKQIRQGTISFEQINLSKNQIRFALIDYLREIQDFFKQNPNLGKKIFEHHKEDFKYHHKQIHKGTGDNIIGNKIINNN
ncbi:MAG: hypothetical protein AB8G11_09995 [Saprospiraceae bacterium]